VPWEDSLQKAGLKVAFVGNGLSVPPQLRITMGAFQEPEPARSEIPAEIVLVEDSYSGLYQDNFASRLQAILERTGSSLIRSPWSQDMSSLQGATIIVTEFKKSILRDISAETFYSLRKLILGAESILWVSGDIGPDAAMASGLARSVCNEVPGMQFKTLQMASTPLESYPDIISRVVHAPGPDTEFRVIDGEISISRFLEDRPRNETLAATLGESEPNTQHLMLKETPGPVKLCVKNPGMLDSLCFEPDSTPETPLKEGQVEVDVKASGIKYVHAIGS
jgi:zearalenone synthase (highly reducing iterative type I polyketide synthase)